MGLFYRKCHHPQRLRPRRIQHPGLLYALDDEFLPDVDLEHGNLTYTVGKLKVISPPVDFEDMDMGGKGAENPEMEAMMTEMLADMRLTLKLKIAGGIESTNATFTEGDTVTLFDVAVGKMLAQKDELKKIGETAKTDKGLAEATFSKLDGIKIELKEDVTVTLK